jgi:predicted glycoside hydrolase/deacetylase ChbG (UPF0249 family)
MRHDVDKQAVVCADDYALNAAVSQGIVALSALGRLSATSVMSLSPRWAEDAAALREQRARLDVGVHLDWTSSFAIDAGHGSALNVVMLRAALRLYRPREVQTAIAQQLDAFERYWHAAPDHVDGHQHIQQFPVIRDALAEVLLKRYGSHVPKPWLRVSQVAQPGLKAQVISSMGAQPLRRWAQAHDWPVVAPLLGAYGFDGDLAGYAQHMQTWLADLPAHAPGLIMCHPALSAEGDDAIGPARQREFAYLASEAFGQRLREARVRLVRGSGLPFLDNR